MRLVAALLGCGALVAAVRGEDACLAESCPVTANAFADDEFMVCNVGSSCRDEYNEANGTEHEIWPAAALSLARRRLEAERNRVMLNEYQPSIAPKFTEVGYKKEKLDPETYKALLVWYTREFEHSEPEVEVWPEDNTYVNHWKVDTAMTRSPRYIQNLLFDELLPEMEEWSGIKLESTSCYGVRHYYRGAILANHVDRVDTHVISGIINVEQENVDTPWPLYVRGHDGVARKLFIEPGEIIFYESASVIHGRPEAFEGDRFANIFVHFTPQTGWDLTAFDVRAAASEGDRKKRREARMVRPPQAPEVA